MNYIIFDLEFNQSLNRKLTNPKLSQEIIEIGAVKLDNNFNIIDNYNTFVKPNIYKKMNYGVMKVTGIKNEHLKFAPSLEDSLNHFKKWIGDDAVLCSWGRDDIIELKKSCNFYNLDSKWIQLYIDIQAMYINENSLDINQQISLEKALSDLDVYINTPLHRALEDSKYTTIIFRKLSNIDFSKYIVDVQTMVDYCVEKINNLNDARADKRKIKRNCPKCGHFLSIKYDWQYKRKSFWSLRKCNRCNQYISSNMEIKVKANNEIVYKFHNKLITEESFNSYKRSFE